MKKSSSNPKYSNQQKIYSGDTHPLLNNKIKTISTILNTENEHNINQQTTKKNSISNNMNNTEKIKSSNYKSSNKSSKANILKSELKYCRINSAMTSASQTLALTQIDLIHRNQKLSNENKVLREQFCKIQQSNLKNQTKIQLLIGRMSQMRSQSESIGKNNDQELKQIDEQLIKSCCNNAGCCQKRRQLKSELQRQRIKVYELEKEKKNWDKNKQKLKNQYNQLLIQIQNLKEKN